MRRARRLVTIAVLIAVLLGATGCRNSGISGTGEGGGAEARRLVKTALKSLKFRRGSRMMYSSTPLFSGYHVVVPEGSMGYRERGINEAAVDEAGYLLFVDERPKYDWAHPAQIVLVASDPNIPPRVLFRRVPASGIVVTNTEGRRVKLEWHKL